MFFLAAATRKLRRNRVARPACWIVAGALLVPLWASDVHAKDRHDKDRAQAQQRDLQGRHGHARSSSDRRPDKYTGHRAGTRDKHDRHHADRDRHDQHAQRRPHHSRHHGHHRERRHDHDRTQFGFSIHLGSGGHHATYHRRSQVVKTKHGYCAPKWYCRSGFYKRVWVPPVYRTYYGACGRRYQVIVRCGYYRSVWVPRKCNTPHHHHH